MNRIALFVLMVAVICRTCLQVPTLAADRNDGAVPTLDVAAVTGLVQDDSVLPRDPIASAEYKAFLLDEEEMGDYCAEMDAARAGLSARARTQEVIEAFHAEGLDVGD